jgi:hypothetical protein
MRDVPLRLFAAQSGAMALSLRLRKLKHYFINLFSCKPT